MKTTINIGGDFCITSSYVSQNLFSDEVKDFFKNSDINIVNLECPVVKENINTKVKITKTGPHLHTTGHVFKQLKEININMVTLANNHILDFGEEGLISTIENCKRNDIAYVGAGVNLADASKTKIIESNGLRIGLVNFCENEWSVATRYGGGANPLDLIDNLNKIKLIREKADIVLVIIHGGHEYYNLPSKRMVKTYRFFAEQGVDAVIGHHTHCVSGYEIHNNVPIFYSLGNMLFTKSNINENWYTGLILQLTLETAKPLKFELHPIRQSKQNFELTILQDELKESVLTEVKGYSDIIGNENELERHWELFIKSKERTLNVFSPLNVIPGSYFRAALRRLGFNRILMKKQYLAQILNHIRCESHHNVVSTLLEQKITGKHIQKCSR